MTDKTCWVIAYDIVCDNRRRRVSNTLEDYGFRMQKSVFECNLSSRTLEKLIKKLDSLIDEQEDSILFYMLCRACVKQNRSIGLPPDRINAEKDFEII